LPIVLPKVCLKAINFELRKSLCLQQFVQAIESLLTQYGPFHLLGPQTKLNFTTPVGKPETIGADRLGLVAAAVDLYPNQHSLVICLGTCITYNFVNNRGQFLGGSISPGMQMRFKSMNDLTALLPLIEPAPSFGLVGYDTKSNLLSGVVLGMSAEINGIIDAYEAKYSNFNALLTGGDLSYFVPHLKRRIFADPNLIYKGLYAISEKAAYTPNMNGAFGQSINFSNPASYGGIYMTTFDIGLNLSNNTLKRTTPAGKEKSTYLIPNYIVVGVPLSKAKKIGFAFGLRPLTQINYSVDDFLYDPKIGDSIYTNYKGEGGINQVFLGVGKSWKYLSIGMNTGYNLGRKKINVVKAILFNSDSTYFFQSLSSTNTSFGGVFLNLGVQGEFPLSSSTNSVTKDKTEYALSYGGTYNLDQRLSGKQDVLRSNGTFTDAQEIAIDTALFQKNIRGKVELPSSFTAGIALHKKITTVRGNYDQWVVGVELNQSNWKDGYKFYGVRDQVRNATMLRAGAQLCPNPYAYESYWSTVTYRFGLFSGNDYINVNNNGLKVIGLTMGLGLPVRKYRSYDYQFTLLNLALQMGRRGESASNFRENFVQFTVGYSLSDVWFNKRKYD